MTAVDGVWRRGRVDEPLRGPTAPGKVHSPTREESGRRTVEKSIVIKREDGPDRTLYVFYLFTENL